MVVFIMKKIPLIAILLISFSYGETIGSATNKITDSMIDCFNDNPIRGYAVFSQIHFENKDSVNKLLDYFNQYCPYVIARISNVLGNAPANQVRQVMFYAFADMLRAIANKLNEKASGFANLGNSQNE